MVSPSPDRQPYQVVARRFRPRSFAEMVGQEEIVRGLQVALKQAQGTYADGADAADMSMNYNAIRISTHIFNDENDVDRAMDALKEALG